MKIPEQSSRVTWNTEQLDGLLPQIWHALETGCRDLQDPFRTPALGTVSATGAALRTVVLRQVEPAQRLLICHSDFRAGKVHDLQRHRQVEWLFYHPQDKIQIRARAIATVHRHDAVATAAWRKTPLPSRVNYCTRFAPGTKIKNPDVAWPAALRNRELTLEESEAGWPNFAVIVTAVERFEFLQLDPGGHRRAAFTLKGNRFVSSWLVP